jgi:hypothetical protein
MNQPVKLDLSYVLAPENQHEAVAIARALCGFAEAATDVQMLVCIAVVEAKGDIKLVSEFLGYEISRIRGHLQSRLSSRIIKELAKSKLQGEGYLLAVSTLMEIAGSQSQTGNARNNAAKTLMELAEVEEARRPSDDDGGVDLNNMTLKELERYCDTIKQNLVNVTPQTIEHSA